MSGLETFGGVALYILAFAGTLAIGYCAFIGARQMDRACVAGQFGG